MFAALVCFLDLKNNWFDFSSRVLVVASKPHDSLARTMNGEANVPILVNLGLVTITDQSYRTFYTKS